MNTCYVCDTPLEFVSEDREIQMGGRSVVVLHELLRCPECGEEFLTPDQMDAVQRRASSAIREREGLLTPEEIRQIRESLGLTQAEVISEGPEVSDGE